MLFLVSCAGAVKTSQSTYEVLVALSYVVFRTRICLRG